jgi:predicted phosphoadenosine phosphosulfate sulfurtransferase
MQLVYLPDNVYEAAKKRIKRIFSEFDNVCVSFSGGKDSTVVLQLTIEVAKEINRLPVKVVFIDQEAEWKSTVDYVDYVMRLPEVEPYWFQSEFKIFNATSNADSWLYCWQKGAEHKWIHPQSDISIKADVFKKGRFHDTFDEAMSFIFGEGKTGAYLTGVRGQESQRRQMGLTSFATYKDITWGMVLNQSKARFSFHPIYDWTITDVWKYIHDNGHKYNTHYDRLYRQGTPIRDMRVSNIHHETALKNLYLIQEFEPKTWDRLCQRLGGIHAAGILGEKDFQTKKLPFMFKSWREYRDFLLEKLIVNPEDKETFRTKFKKLDRMFDNTVRENGANKAMVQALLANDVYMTKLDAFVTSANKEMNNVRNNIRKLTGAKK